MNIEFKVVPNGALNGAIFSCAKMGSTIQRADIAISADVTIEVKVVMCSSKATGQYLVPNGTLNGSLI